MATEFAVKAKEAFVDDDFQRAVDLYTEAIKLDPNSADLFADRSQANIKLSNFTEAVADANKAIELDPTLAKAYLRNGTACFKLEEYHTAKAALEKGFSLAKDDSRFAKLIKECEERIAEENRGTNGFVTTDLTQGSHISSGTQASDRSLGSSEVAIKPKYRHTFYQKPDEVVVTIFAKGIQASNVAIEFGEQILSVVIDVPGEDVYRFQPRLFGKIISDRCRYDVLSTKVEIRLAKAEPLNWTSLEYSTQAAVPQKIYASSGREMQKPVYPSSKPRKVDWDKLEAEVKKEEKDEKLDGDAGLNKFFGDIYINADEDMRRAMNKSFIESNGTVLSTNWKEVSSKKVEGSPPDGMELKKWEY